jgi:hypothetical protein
MSFSAQGDPVKGEVVRASGATSIAVTLYDAGIATARTQTSDEFLTITDLILISTDGGTYNLVFYSLATGTIADGAGLRIAKGIADAKGGLAHHFETPVTGPKGYGAALIAATGAVDLIVTGNLTKV